MASYEQAKSLLNNSVSRPTLYSLSINNTNGLIGTDVNNYLKLFVSRVNLPGPLYEGLTSMGQERMGVIQPALAAGQVFGGGNRFTFEVIESSDFTAYNGLRRLFDSAMATGANSRGSQRMAYYDDYTFDVNLVKLEFPNNQSGGVPRDGNSDIDAGYKESARFRFEKCHMTEISTMDFGSSQYDAYLSYNCTIAFETYTHNKIPGVND